MVKAKAVSHKQWLSKCHKTELSLKQVVWKVQLVMLCSPIAYAYNLDDLYITANIDEKDVSSVEKATKLT